MSERPKDGADPDATVMMPARGAGEVPDPDATVRMPAAGTGSAPDPDATVMLPAGEPDPDATVAIPTPGRRREAAPAAAPSGRAASTAELGALGGLNALVGAANPILAVVPQIRQALKHPDPEGLRASLRGSLDAFERDAQAAGVSRESVATAGHALCALLDESAACTPWGADWAQGGLLAERHLDRSGGREKFFELLETMSAAPASNLDLLEFFYVCLALGFEGRFRDSPDGRRELAELRGRLRELLRQHRPAHDGELSGRWRGVSAPARRAPGALGLWAAGCGAALVLAAVYLGYSFSLGSQSDPVARELAQLKAVPPAERPAAAAESATPGISKELAAEIARGEIAVRDAAGRSTIVIRSDHLFASGSARIEPAVATILRRIAEALDRVPGTILVTGHTDEVPIRTARFPSNWELSTERAASVVKLMAGKLSEPARLRAEGLADSEPLAPNNSAANRARNRRVVIILRSAP